MTTKRPYTNLSDYAAQQGAPESAFLAAGWKPALVQHPDPETHQDRPALEYSTPTGARWRFTDGAEKLCKYTSPKGYVRCWYRLPEAIAISDATGAPLVICNGEAGTVVAQYYSVPATCVTGGEGLSDVQQVNRLMGDLKAVYNGPILVALDCDLTGRTQSGKRVRQLLDAGYTEARAVDLALGEKGGDLADFCKLHQVESRFRLDDLKTLPAEEVKPVIRRAEPTETRPGAKTVDWEAERLLFWREVVLPAVEKAATHRQGKHFKCLNPAHPDTNPSARISYDRDADGLYVCTCGVHGRDQVAGWLGLTFMDWWKEQRAHLFPPPERPMDEMVEAMTVKRRQLEGALRLQGRRGLPSPNLAPALAQVLTWIETPQRETWWKTMRHADRTWQRWYNSLPEWVMKQVEAPK